MAAALLVEEESLPTEMALTPPTEAKESPLCPLSLPGNDTVVGVYESHVRLIHDFVQELPFGLGHSLYRSKYTRVRRADVEQNPDRGLRDPAQVSDVPQPPRRQLEDHGGVIRRQSQQGPGYTDLVVLVLRCLQHPEPPSEDRGDHLLDRRLPGRAGDGDYGQVESTAVVAGHPAQGTHRRIHGQQTSRRGQTRQLQAIQPPTIDDGRTRAPLEGLRDMVVAIEALALQGHEDLAGLEAPRVG